MISECIGAAIRLVRLSHHGKQLDYVNRCTSEVTVFGDRQRLLQVFVNLLSNASDASSTGNQVEIFWVDGDQRLEIRVIDQGIGIPKSIQGRVFEPFFTTQQPGKGTGLGPTLGI